MRKLGFIIAVKNIFGKEILTTCELQYPYYTFSEL